MLRRHSSLLWCLQLFLAAQVSSSLASETAELTAPARPGRSLVTIKSGELDRVAHVQVPSTYTPETPPPLVLVLHGAGGNGRVTLDHNGWSAKAEKNGFVAVAPDGLPARTGVPASFRANPALWNSGQLNSRSPRAAIDDVAYIRQLLDELKSRVPHDPRRVYCCGHSNGGGMTFRLANELSERFAAIGTVAGMLAIDEPKPRKPMPTLYILGTKDPLTPMEGGQVQLPWGTRHNTPVAESMAKWAKAIGCETQPETVSDSDGIKKQVYRSRSGGATLTVLLIDGHGHQWPGSKSFLPESVTGPVSSKLNATDALWDFFSSVK